MKAKWNAHNGIEWYVVRRFTISSLTEKQFSSYWKPNREYITVYFLFGFQKSTKQRIRNITLYLALCWLGWGGRIWTLEITESESAALPLGDTPIFDFVLCRSATYLLYHTFLCLSSLFFKILKKIFLNFFQTVLRLTHDDLYSISHSAVFVKRFFKKILELCNRYACKVPDRFLCILYADS